MPEESMTSRQSWAIFCLSGYEVRDTDIAKSGASDIISKLKANDPHAIVLIEGCGGKKVNDKPKNVNDWQALYDKAHKAGHEAATNHKPVPMTVVERANPLDDSSQIVKQYEPISDGVCGFAWINIRPGTHSFCKWLKKNELASTDSYYGGLSVWVGDYNQSYEKKRAYAGAFSKIVNEHAPDSKLQAMPMSRMD
jgi:hypothetical protein